MIGFHPRLSDADLVPLALMRALLTPVIPTGPYRGKKRATIRWSINGTWQRIADRLRTEAASGQESAPRGAERRTAGPRAQAVGSGPVAQGRRVSRPNPSSTSASVRTMAVNGAERCGALVLM